MSDIYPVAVPKWGIEMVEGTITGWNKQVGDPVDKGDEIFEMESDKIVNVWESPVDGVPLEAFWLFQVVFAGAAATIVAGAVAERMKFVAYLFYSFVITAFIYPIAGHWVWGGGWLAALNFHDC